MHTHIITRVPSKINTPLPTIIIQEILFDWYIFHSYGKVIIDAEGSMTLSFICYTGDPFLVSSPRSRDNDKFCRAFGWNIADTA